MFVLACGGVGLDVEFPGQVLASNDVSNWSLRYLARASNVLLVTSDALLAGQAGLCKIQKNQIQPMTMNLKVLIDEKVKLLSGSQKAVVDGLAESCERECSCDVFALLYETKEAAADKEMLAKVSRQGGQMNAAGRIACAKNFAQFCSSRLFKSLSR